jgi:hypothetical protein
MRFWLWPNLLSLDAPLVAVVWLLLFAGCLRVHVSPVTAALLACGSWTIYALDRVLDVARPESRLEPGERHRFYERRWRAFVVAICLVGIASAATALTIPAPVRRGGLLLCLLVLLYLGIVHGFGGRLRQWFPKEYAVGALFAAGVTLPFWSRMRHADPIELTAFVLFAVACQVNTVAIEYWESRERGRKDVSPATRWLGPRLIEVAAALSATAAALFIGLRGSPFAPAFAAVSLSATAFAWIASTRDRVPLDLSCVLMDGVLLSPLVTGWGAYASLY